LKYPTGTERVNTQGNSSIKSNQKTLLRFKIPRINMDASNHLAIKEISIGKIVNFIQL